jgi:hypothetical protein
MVNNVPCFSVSEANIAAGHPPPPTTAPGGERREAARRRQHPQGESSDAEPEPEEPYWNRRNRTETVGTVQGP